MKLYLLSFKQSGFGDEYLETFLGVYSSEQNREAAIEHYIKTKEFVPEIRKYINGDMEVAKFIKVECELDVKCNFLAI